MNRPLDRGLLVVVEGIDGAGKSTLARSLAGRLRELGHEVVSSREPTDGPHGRRLRQSAVTGRLSPGEELETFIADRKEHVEHLILPSLMAGKIVVLDRYYFSTAAYQGSRGIDWRDILRRNEEFAPEPDVLLIPELGVERALERIRLRGEMANEFERLESLQKVDAVFQALDRPELRRLDAGLAPELLSQKAVDIVVEALLLRRARIH